MFGNNPVRASESDLSGAALRIQEVFYTLQGEGPFSGRPCTFIRLAGCNLRCHFCDTDFDTKWENKLTLTQILKAMDFESGFSAKKHGLVVITGGEPLIQNIIPLINMLLEAGTDMIQIETAGTTWIPGLEDFINQGRLVVVCSPKTPKVHPKVQEFATHWKYVVAYGETSEEDGLPSKSTQVLGAEAKLARPTSEFAVTWVSPRDDHDTHKNIENMTHARNVALKHGHRLSLQVHKIVNVR